MSNLSQYQIIYAICNEQFPTINQHDVTVLFLAFYDMDYMMYRT